MIPVLFLHLQEQVQLVQIQVDQRVQIRILEQVPSQMLHVAAPIRKMIQMLHSGQTADSRLVALPIKPIKFGNINIRERVCLTVIQDIRTALRKIFVKRMNMFGLVDSRLVGQLRHQAHVMLKQLGHI